ncbi:MAG: hypothetical protein KKB50_12195 [Planctomycetes bacterium]|nr:hypothetical protein [Planctomycetota bacterium]
MSTPAPAGSPARLASLGRAVVETGRFTSPQHAQLLEALHAALDPLDKKQRSALLQEIGPLLHAASGTTASAAPAPPERTAGGGEMQQLLQQRASLELKWQTEAARAADLSSALREEQENHQEALETLSLQQRKLQELEEERAKLLAEVSRIESQLRLQINETEQVQLKYEKLKGSRGKVSEQMTEQTEDINRLKSENEQLRQELEATLRDRDTNVAGARAETQQAEAHTAEAAFAQLWARMGDQLPEVFVETHVPTMRTFENLSDALIGLVRAFAILEGHVNYMLQQLKQVGERGDKLNHFYLMFKKNPGLLETLADYLPTGRRKGYFDNMLRAVQAWARAFGTGAYKVVVKSPASVGKELNYKNWPIKSGFTKSEDAAIGEYFRDTAMRSIPDALGTLFRKQIADSAYEDYDDSMKRQK